MKNPVPPPLLCILPPASRTALLQHPRAPGFNHYSQIVSGRQGVKSERPETGRNEAGGERQKGTEVLGSSLPLTMAIWFRDSLLCISALNVFWWRQLVTTGCFIFTILFFFLLNWSIVALQCCVSSCCRAKWISFTYKYSPSFLDFFPTSVQLSSVQSSRSVTSDSLRPHASQHTSLPVCH